MLFAPSARNYVFMVFGALQGSKVFLLVEIMFCISPVLFVTHFCHHFAKLHEDDSHILLKIFIFGGVSKGKVTTIFGLRPRILGGKIIHHPGICGISGSERG